MLNEIEKSGLIKQLLASRFALLQAWRFAKEVGDKELMDRLSNMREGITAMLLEVKQSEVN